ncbi:hypothetical protein F2Q68_00005546 [Brassica cretica]|uniref:Btz domain-containing protein n=1 Tax=Brassica cretica TaxID=69181 RepID=A0A8S9JIH7_BRACR|nr:hypothetical protein F2Q68_00005546 [Brassica cretica]
MDSRVSIATGDYGRFGLNGIDLWHRGMNMEEYYKDGLHEDEGHYDDRARSYKGVVINGNGGQQDRGREKREYQGKGKGKMFEEGDSKWVKAADRECKTHNNNHCSGHRGEEESSRHRNYRREHSRTHQDDRARAPAGSRGERGARSEARMDVSKEGEVNGMEQSSQKEEKIQEPAKPSQAFLAELMETQGDQSKIRDEDEGHYDDRARSYKGVVINGDGGQQDRGREKREYQGKGKGKMFEEGDSKWVKAADRERKTHNNNHRSGHRGEEESSRHRNYRREHSRTHQDDRARAPAGSHGERGARSETRMDVSEEGEVNGMEQSSQKEEKI